MRKRIALILCLLLLFTACAKQETTTPSSEITPSTGTTPLPQKTAQDVDNTFLVNDNFERMAQSDTVIYKLSTDRSAILFYDKASGISGPLCGKPDCSHTGTDCNAYVSNGHSIQYYGSLYIVAADVNTFPVETWLWKCDLSGGNREKIRKLDSDAILFTYQPQHYYVHRGTLYLFGNFYTAAGAKASTHASVLSVPLDDSDDFTVLWEQTVENELYTHFRFFDKYIYLCAENGLGTANIYQINTETNQVNTIFSDESSDFYYEDIAVSDDGTLYLAGSDRHTTGYVWKIENGNKSEVLTIPVMEPYTPKILDGYVVSTRTGENRFKSLTVKTITGEEVYGGPLFAEEIPEISWDPNACFFGILGSNGPEITFSLTYDMEKLSKVFIISFDATQNMKPVLVWDSEDTK